MSGLLSVCDADQHGGVVLPNLKLVRHRPEDAAGHLRKPLFFAHGHVVPLKNALRMKNLVQQLDQDRLPALHAERRDLKREAGGEFVDRQPRKAVGLAEDDAAGVLEAERPPILPRAQQPAAEKRAVDRLVPAAREHTDADFRAGIPESARAEAQAAVEHVNDAACLAGVVRPVKLIFKDPRRAAADAGFLAAAQADLSRYHMQNLRRQIF